MKFRADVEPAEPMRGLEVPEEVVQALGGGKRPAVTITINGHSWKSRIAIMRGRYLIGLSSANRRAAGIATGDEAEVEVELDVEPRVVVEPTDFVAALDADPTARGRVRATVLQPQAGARACHRDREETRDTITTDRCRPGEPASSRVNDKLNAQFHGGYAEIACRPRSRDRDRSEALSPHGAPGA